MAVAWAWASWGTWAAGTPAALAIASALAVATWGAANTLRAGKESGGGRDGCGERRTHQRTQVASANRGVIAGSLQRRGLQAGTPCCPPDGICNFRSGSAVFKPENERWNAHQMGIWVPACAAALAVAVARPAAPPVAVAEAAACANACKEFGGGAVAERTVSIYEMQNAAARRLDHPHLTG